MKHSRAISCLVLSAGRKNLNNRLINELVLPVIGEAGLTVTNVGSNGEVAPLTDALAAITTADACFIDLTEADRRTWAIVGAATALKVPLCLVADEKTLDDFGCIDVNDVIRFPSHAFPSDYERLKKAIHGKLRDIVNSIPGIANSAGELTSAEFLAMGTANVKAGPQQSRPEPFSPGNADDRVKFHEHLALKLILQHGLESGVTLKQLAKEMNKFGIVQATSIAVSGLKRRKLIERHESRAENEGTSSADVFVLTDAGKKWLTNHSESMPIPEFPIIRDGIALGLIDHLLAV